MTSPIICTLRRITTDNAGTFGVFEARDLLFSCTSLELPDRNNRPMISRIPAGTYTAEWSYSHRFKRHRYRLADTAPRVGILIHPANFAGDKSAGWKSELSGCIALGRCAGVLNNGAGIDQPALLDSRSTVAAFERDAAERPLIIYITDEPQE